MIDPRHLRFFVIRPTLEHLGLWSKAAEELLLGTAAQESQLGRWLRQLGQGPALGIYQCEPATHDDIVRNFLAYRKRLASRIFELTVPGVLPELTNGQQSGQLVWNLAYATAIARVHYLRVPRPLPESGDLEGQADYWKHYYNTHLGKGTVGEYIGSYRKYVHGAA